MKATEFHFRKPVAVLQVFRQVIVYNKQERSFDLRKEKTRWECAASTSGYVNDRQLFLPESFVRNSRIHSCDLVTMEDQQLSAGYKRTTENNRCFALHHPVNLFIFQVKKNAGLELFFKYDQWEIGIPARSNFQLGIVKPNEPLCVAVNGKTDFSLTGRRERHFKEQLYVVEHLGHFEKCTLLKEPLLPVKKEIKCGKFINLLKPLW